MTLKDDEKRGYVSMPGTSWKQNENDNKLIGEFDAKVWAEEFVKMVKAKPGIATDEGTMIGWFANAIMAGYDQRASEEVPSASVRARNKAGLDMDERWCPWKNDICRR